MNNIVNAVKEENKIFFLNGLLKENVINKLIYHIDGENFKQFVFTITGLLMDSVVQNAMPDEWKGVGVQEFQKDGSITNNKVFIWNHSGFKPDIVFHSENKPNRLNFRISYDYDAWFDEKTFLRELHPYELVGIDAPKGIQTLGLNEDTYIKVPSILFHLLTNEQDNQAIWDDIRIAVETGLIVFSAGEYTVAKTALGRAFAIANIVIPTLDVFIATSDLKQDPNYQDFIDVWDKAFMGYAAVTGVRLLYQLNPQKVERFITFWDNNKDLIKNQNLLTNAAHYNKMDDAVVEIKKIANFGDEVVLSGDELLTGVKHIDDFLSKKPIINTLSAFELPNGYRVYTKSNGKKWIRRINAINPDTPRLTVKDGRIVKFTGPADFNQFTEFVYHVKSDRFVQDIIDDIDPAFFGKNTRFGEGFYVASEGEIAIAELIHHGGDMGASKVIKFSLDKSQLKVLDLTDESIAKIWNLDEARVFEIANLGNGEEVYYRKFQEIAQQASNEGYNSIRFNSYRNSNGFNYVVLGIDKKFYKRVLKPQMVMPGVD